MSEEKAKYVLLKGNHHSVDPVTKEVTWFEPGATVELTIAQAKAFKDKIQNKYEYDTASKHKKRIDAVVAKELAKIAKEDADAKVKDLGTTEEEEEDEDEDETPVVPAKTTVAAPKALTAPAKTVAK